MRSTIAEPTAAAPIDVLASKQEGFRQSEKLPLLGGIVAISEATAKRRLPGMLAWLAKIRAAVEPELVMVKYREDDDLAFMGLCFLGKQVDHAYSLERLVPLRDAVLVSRSMFEGVCQLLWAAQDEGVRPARWRAFAVVEEWRNLPNRRAAGFNPTPKMMAELDEKLREIEPLVLTKKAKAAKERGDPLPHDPYHTDWRAGTKLTEIFRQVDAADLRDAYYHDFSGWAHWGPLTLASRLSRSDEEARYGPGESYFYAASALALGIQCLLQTARPVFSHLDLPAAAKIARLTDEYEQWHAEQINTDSGQES